MSSIFAPQTVLVEHHPTKITIEVKGGVFSQNLPLRLTSILERDWTFAWEPWVVGRELEKGGDVKRKIHNSIIEHIKMRCMGKSGGECQ